MSIFFNKNMNKIQLNVPEEVKYISEWNDYEIPYGKCIIDKKVCGCGYTQFCLTNQDDIILCSPRKSLLENKAEQNPTCYYFEPLKPLSKLERKRLGLNSEEEATRYLYKIQFDMLSDYINNCINNRFKLKILVTYDSLPKLLGFLSKMITPHKFDKIKVIVDEFHLIFSDAKFKAGVELDFVEYLMKYCKNVVFLSGTPMLENYLNGLPEFSDLDYYELLWNSSRLSRITITRIISDNLEKTAVELVKLYKEGRGPVKEINGVFYQSKEAVLFVNNVSMITNIIKSSKLLPEEVNIITAKTPDNLRKIRKCGKGFDFGRIPTKGQAHKLITLCSSTAFCGVDMYSESAKAFVFSNCNLKTMTVDISLELPQIVGRQRLDTNPFRREITIFYSDSIRNYSYEDFKREIELKTKTTYESMNGFDILRSSDGVNIDFERKKLRLWISEMNYSEDYTSLSKDTGLPVFNSLMLASDMRSWELQNKIYNNEKEVLNVLSSVGDLTDSNSNVFSMLEKAISESLFEKRLEIINNYLKENPNDIVFIPEEYSRFIGQLEKSECYRKDVLEKKIERKQNLNLIFEDKSFRENVYNNFLLNENYLKKEIKKILNDIASTFGYTNVTLKANDIKNVFNVIEVMVTNKETKKRDAAYRILSIKEN